jgi:hypothetical protein
MKSASACTFIVAAWCLWAWLAAPAAAAGDPFPLQLEMRVPFDPTAFTGGGEHYLTYELHLTSFTGNALTLRRIEVLDAAAGKPVAAFDGEQLDALLQHPGGSDAQADPRQLPAGAAVVVFMWVRFTGEVPERLYHRVTTSDSSLEGAAIGTRHNALHVLRPPLTGDDWLAADGPSNSKDNHHRRGILIAAGRPVISRRYAIDWTKVENGATFSGDESNRQSYHAYGQPVLAVADAKVIAVTDGAPDNVPGHDASFRPAVPITLDTVGGNSVTLDLGGGEFAYYFHLQPGSLQVRVGDRVRAGQLVARVGASGDAREPHLHFEVTTSSERLVGEGVPYLLDRFRVRSPDGSWQPRTRQLPLDGMVVSFGAGTDH